MGLNTTQKDRIEERRQLIAKLRVRRPRITVRQIRDLLYRRAEPGVGYNPDTGEPWSIGTIQSDIEAIRDKIREDYDRSTAELRNRELELLDELQFQALDNGDITEARRISESRRKLLGLDEPEDINVQGETVVKVVKGDLMDEL